MKKPVVADQKSDLIESLGDFTKLKNLDRAMLSSVLEDVIRTLIKKKYGADDNFDVIVNVDKGDIQIFHSRTVVEDGEVEDESRQIAISEAQRKDPDYVIGDSVGKTVPLYEFGRRLVLSAKQMLAQRIKELEKSLVFTQYKDIIGEIVSGEVYQVWRNEILVIEDGNEVLLPKTQWIPKDKFKKGDLIKAVVEDVQMKNSSPVIIISRSSPRFLEKLFEQEVPEIADGLITVKKIVRDPGERAKVAVESYDDRIDPVGACVGMKGSRIHGIVRELRNENIDVINYTSNPALYIQRALTPAKVSEVIIDEAKKTASVYLPSDQVSLAIGKGGQNIKLASALTGYKIDAYRNDIDPSDEIEEDVDLEEFSDEIEEHLISRLKESGFDTARDVLARSAEELSSKTGIELEEIHEILRILNEEFED